MRKNNTYSAQVADSRNSFIDLLKTKAAVIVVANNLLIDLEKEVNDNLSNKKQGKFLKGTGIAIILLSLSNPIGWILGGISFLGGTLIKTFDDLKKYRVYEGTDFDGKQILVLHRKNKVDLEYDKIIYPDFVKDVNYKKHNKKVHIKNKEV